MGGFGAGTRTDGAGGRPDSPTHRKAPGPVDRQRGWVLRFATACGFLPTIAYVAFLVVLPLPGLRLWFDLTVLLFPLIVAYAIVRHNFLALDELAREALLFGSLLAAFAVGSALLGAGLTPVVERWAPSMAASVQPLAVAALVVVVAPLHTRLRRRLHERFQRLPVSWQELSARVEAAAKPERAPAEYAREVVEQLAGNSRSRRVLLLVRNSHNDSWWLAAAAGLKVDEPGPQVGDARTLAGLLGEEDSL